MHVPTLTHTHPCLLNCILIQTCSFTHVQTHTFSHSFTCSHTHLPSHELTYTNTIIRSHLQSCTENCSLEYSTLTYTHRLIHMYMLLHMCTCTLTCLHMQPHTHPYSFYLMHSHFHTIKSQTIICQRPPGNQCRFFVAGRCPRVGDFLCKVLFDVHSEA